MDENGKRNARKSKLELRECSDDEDENIMALQADIEKLVNLKRNLKNSNTEELKESLCTPNSINFQVQVKVEKCVEDSDGGESTVEVVDDTKSGASSTGVGKSLEKKYILRVLQPTIKGCSKLIGVEYVFTKRSIRRALEAQSKENSSEADKYVEIGLRNVHGDICEPPMSLHEEMIQNGLQQWSTWNEVCPGYRDSPLLYKCYICNKGWWRLHPFREHIKGHHDKKLTIKAEQCQYEFCLAVCLNHAQEPRSVKVDGDCWKCDRPLELHNATDAQPTKYECDGCKLVFCTCTKLTMHYTICAKYIELKFKKHALPQSGFANCSLCGRNCITKALLNKHLMEYHSPRSDEPMLTQEIVCRKCKMKFFIHNFHDCPKKVKSFKCTYCCRKFVSIGLLELHNAVASKCFQECEHCGHAVKECVMLDHMVQHTKNYEAVYWCSKCDYNILFPKYHLYNNHLKLHGRGLEKRRYGNKMLLSVNCMNGKFAVSKTTVEISDDKVLDYLSGKDHLKLKRTAHGTSGSEDAMSVSVVTSSNEDESGSDKKNSVCKVERVGVARAYPDNFALQLDAEIQRDVEMEAAISKVFKASKSYKKFLEKESVEPVDDYLYDDDLIILEKPDDVLIVIESDPEEENIVESVVEDNSETMEKLVACVSDVREYSIRRKTTVSEVAATEVGNAILDQGVVVKEESKTDSDIEERLNDEINVAEKTDDDVEDDGTSQDLHIDVKNEPVDSDVGGQSVADSVDGLKKATNDTMETDAALLPDIIRKESIKRYAKPLNMNAVVEVKKAKINTKDPVKNETKCSYEGKKDSYPEHTAELKNHNVSGVNIERTDYDVEVKEESDSSVEYLEMDDFDNDVDWDVTIKTETVGKDANEMRKGSLDNGKEPAGGDSKSSKGKSNLIKSNRRNCTLYTCEKCPFVGNYRKYMDHVLTKCAGRNWDCTRCGLNFNELYSYIRHLKEHTATELTCPDCKQAFESLAQLHRHVVMHVRSMFVNDVNHPTNEKWMYLCRNCGHSVHLDSLFGHWECHVSERGEGAAGGAAERAEAPRMSPEMLKSVIQKLLLTAKGNKGLLVECQVCKKKFERKNDTKRHLIEHLLTEALLDKLETNNRLRCQICGQDLDYVYTWKQHMRDHAALPEYKCKICKKRFSDSSNFSKHRKVHNFFSYICDMCGGKFQAEASIVKHLMLHEQPPVFCNVCDASFYNKSRLKIHMKMRHQLNTFPCIICKKRFGCLKDKWDHMWVEHKQRNVEADCPVCSKSFRRKSDVKQHLREEHRIGCSSRFNKTPSSADKPT